MSILSHARMSGHDPHSDVGGRVRVSGSTVPLRFVDSQGAPDFASFADLATGPVVVCVDELAEYVTRQAYACPDCNQLPGCGCDCCPYALPAVTEASIRLVIPVDVIGDELPPAEDSRAVAQRADWHVDMPDATVTALAARAVYPRRSLWRRLVTRIGGAR
jgi:hypothetical protein